MEQATTRQETRGESRRERLHGVLSLATFLIFFQAYMVAPLIPRLSLTFGVSPQQIGLIVPAYLIPYGISTLIYGLLSDRLGRRRILLASLLAFIVLTALTATAQNAAQLFFWRLLTGLGASGVVPLSLALIGALYRYEERGRPLGWLFGAMAGGAAFGSTVGVVLEPFVGWRMLFVGVAVLGAAAFGLLYPHRELLGGPPPEARPLAQVFSGYRALLAPGRGLRTYVYVLWNGIFHSGVFTWLGLYFQQRYGLGEVGIGLALLGYGIPGFLLGPVIGRAADRFGRNRLVPLGVALAVVAVAVLIPPVPLVAAALAVALLSLGYDMSQPLLAGIVTHLGGQERGGQAMGLNVFLLFTGFGVGSYLFGEALRLGFGTSLGLFAAVQFLAALVALPLFRSETASPTAQAPAARSGA
jgi:predicted MFS family arabinose efflux permease